MGDLLEIIFVSSDRDEEGFDEYFGEMPWLALPFDNREKKVILEIPLTEFVHKLHKLFNKKQLLTGCLPYFYTLISG